MVEQIYARTEKITIPQGLINSEAEMEGLYSLLSILISESTIVPNGYTYASDYSYIKFEYNKTAYQQNDEIVAVNKKVSSVISSIKPGWSDYEKVKFLHDYIVTNCTYDATAPNASSAYGCLVEGRAVCEGYAKAMMLLCAAIEIECLPVIGNSLPDENGEKVPHIWNLIKIDGKWYHFDVTWDDPKTNISNYYSYTFFGLTDEKIRMDHEVTNFALFSYPVANSVDANYYVRNGLVISSEANINNTLEKAIKKAVKNREKFVYVECSSLSVYGKIINLSSTELLSNISSFIFSTLTEAEVENNMTSNIMFQGYLRDETHYMVTFILGY